MAKLRLTKKIKNMYPPELVKPMQAELENAGFTSLHTAQEVEAALKKEGFIVKEERKPYPIFHANRENIKEIKKWNLCIELDDLVKAIEHKCLPNAIILFGSAARGEDIESSDIDICVIAKETEIDLKNWEKKFSRKITLHFVSNFNKLSSELKNNIINGVILQGYLKVF